MSTAYGRSAHRRGFLTLWRVGGQPTLKIVHPISEWTLPAGVTYKPKQDTFTDGSNVKVVVGWTDQPFTEARFIGDESKNDVSIDLPGSKTINTSNVILLWEQVIEDALRAAWGIVIRDELYAIRTWEVNPQGVETPFTIKLSLIKRL